MNHQQVKQFKQHVHQHGHAFLRGVMSDKPIEVEGVRYKFRKATKEEADRVNKVLFKGWI